LLAGEPAREYQRGGASWYGPGFHGRRTASGERYDMHGMTAAHRTLPFGTWVRVHSLVNGREVDVRITDRGPFIRSRVIDVSRGAAEALGMLGLGFKEVVLMVPESTPVGVDMPVVDRRKVVRRVVKAR
jgi:rare lipoprotein A